LFIFYYIVEWNSIFKNNILQQKVKLLILKQRKSLMPRKQVDKNEGGVSEAMIWQTMSRDRHDSRRFTQIFMGPGGDCGYFKVKHGLETKNNT
jgi:hypothetical protein